MNAPPESPHTDPVVFYPDSILGRLERFSTQYHDETAYTFLGDDGRRETQTFGQLADRVRTVASHVRQRVQPGDRVVLLLPQGLEFIAAFLGCLAAGAIAVPAYPPRRNRNAERLHAIIADCAPSALLTVQSVSAVFPTDLGLKSIPICLTDEWRTVSSPHWETDLIRPDTAAFLQYTSGSTGVPKGVVITHGNIACNEQQIQQSFGHRGLDDYSPSIGVCWLPLFHDMGLIGGALQPLYVGFPAVLSSPAGFAQCPVRWLQAITDFRGTTAGAPNFAYDLCARTITDDQKATLDLSSLQVLFNGAEPVRPDTLDRFTQAFRGCGFTEEMFFPCYGLAEGTLLLTGGPRQRRPPRVRLDPAALEAGRIAESSAASASCLVSCGQPAAGVTVAIVDPVDKRLVAEERVGEIWIRSASVAQGYWNRPEETMLTFENRLPDAPAISYLATGDLGFVKAGELYVTGRLKDVVIIRGRKLYPQDIEAVVARAAPFVRENGCAAFSVHDGREERLGLVIEADRSLVHAARKESADIGSLIHDVRMAIAQEFEVAIAELAIVKPGTFPRTSSGKVRRRACRDGLVSRTLDALRYWKE